MPTWTIVYRGADQQEHELVAQTSNILGALDAAMIVGNFLRLQKLSEVTVGLSASASACQYHVQIVNIRQDTDIANIVP